MAKASGTGSGIRNDVQGLVRGEEIYFSLIRLYDDDATGQGLLDLTSQLQSLVGVLTFSFKYMCSSEGFTFFQVKVTGNVDEMILGQRGLVQIDWKPAAASSTLGYPRGTLIAALDEVGSHISTHSGTVSSAISSKSRLSIGLLCCL